MMRFALALGAVAGCASGRAMSEPPDAADGPGSGPADAKVWLDGRIEPQADAQAVLPPDAAVDARPPDAYVCVPQTQQLLQNPVFDLNPAGASWVQQNIDNAYPIVTNDGSLVHSAPYKAWMGGWYGQQKNTASVSDMLYQDVVVPVGTTQLRVTGYYQVRSGETGSLAYDSAQLALTRTDGTPIESVLALTNLSAGTTWVAIGHTFTASVAGQTVRLRMTTTNDITNATSFYFDTLALTATVCL